MNGLSKNWWYIIWENDILKFVRENMLGYINGCSWPVHRLIQKEYMSKYERYMIQNIVLQAWATLAQVQKKNTIQFIAV